MRRTLGLIVLLLGIGSPVLATTCPAFIWLKDDAFHFGFSGTCESIQVAVISVTSNDGDPVCEIRVPQGGELEFKQGWKYGSVPAGFTSVKPCKDLAPDRVYRIEVLGSCLGDRLFRINKKRRLEMIVNRKGEELRCGPKWVYPKRSVGP